MLIPQQMGHYFIGSLNHNKKMQMNELHYWFGSMAGMYVTFCTSFNNTSLLTTIDTIVK